MSSDIPPRADEQPIIRQSCATTHHRRNYNAPPSKTSPCATTRVSRASTGPPCTAHEPPSELPRAAARNRRNATENVGSSKSSTDLVRSGRKPRRIAPNQASRNLVAAALIHLLRRTFFLFGFGLVRRPGVPSLPAIVPSTSSSFQVDTDPACFSATQICFSDHPLPLRFYHSRSTHRQRRSTRT